MGSRTAASEMPWGVLREEDVRVIREWVRETQPYSEQRRILTALRRTLRRFPEQPDDDPFLAKTPVTRLRAPKRPASSVPQLTTREARLLLETCGDRSRLAECRNDAMLALMLLAGLRRVEVTELKRSNYEDEDGVLRVGSRHRASRAVIVRGPCEDYLQRWLARRGSSPGPMFLSLAADGELKPAGLSPSTVNRVLADRACRVGCSGSHAAVVTRPVPLAAASKAAYGSDSPLSLLPDGRRSTGVVHRCARGGMNGSGRAGIGTTRGQRLP